jgi:hypothetical protein
VLSPPAALPVDEPMPKLRDPWLRKLLVALGVMFAVAVALFLVFSLSLGRDIEELRALATQLLT